MAATATLAPPRPGTLWTAFARNRLFWVGLVLLAAIVIVAIFAPLIAPHDPLEQNIVVLSRLIYGARVSLVVGFLAILIAMVIGSTIGIVAGYVGGRFDQIVMGLLDVMLSFPTLLLGLMIAAMLGASLENLIIAIAITEIAPFARVARAPTISLKQRDFVEAGRALGFIGLGVPPPTPTWGSMIREGFENILDAWWLAVFPSLAILVTVLALNLLGDALRDAIDPKLRGE